MSASVSRATRELDRVEGKTKGSLDTRAESLGVAKGKDTRVVNLGLDKGSIVKVRLRTNLEVNVARSLRVVRGASAGLNVLVHAVVVRSTVRGEVAESVQRDSVLRGMVASSQVVAGQLLVLGVVRGLSTKEEAVTAHHSVSRSKRTLEHVQELARVQAWSAVGEGDQGILGLLLRHKRRNHLELETLGEVVLRLNMIAEHISRRPGLRESQTLLTVLPASLQVTTDVRRLVVVETQHTERHTRWRASLDLESRAVDGVVLTKDVRGGLTEVLPARWHRDRHIVDAQLNRLLR